MTVVEKVKVKDVRQRTSKNGRQFFIVELDDGAEIYDWNSMAVKMGVSQDSWVNIQYSEGQYPKLLRIALCDPPENASQITIQDTKNTAPKCVSKSESNLANSKEYLSMKLACELVREEQIQVDEKIDRFCQAADYIFARWTKFKEIRDSKEESINGD